MSFIPDYLAAGIDQPDFVLRLISVLGFPNDEARARHWFNRARNSRTAYWLEGFHPGTLLPDDPTVHQRVVEAATGVPRFDRDKDKGRDGGYGIETRDYRIAAFIPLHILSNDGSLAAAITAFVTGDGVRVSVPDASKRTIERAWKQYRPLAHLAAVYVFRRDLLSDPRAALGWAESLRSAGENYRSLHSGSPLPLLNPAETVKMPASLKLPAVPLNLSSFKGLRFTP